MMHHSTRLRVLLAAMPDTVSPERHEDEIAADELARYFDIAPVADISRVLDEWDSVIATMAYFDRLGIRFTWHEPDPDASQRAMNPDGFMWWPRPGEEWLFRYWSGEKRALLDAWAARIGAHVRERLGVGNRELEPGIHLVGYHLTAPGGYEHDDTDDA